MYENKESSGGGIGETRGESPSPQGNVNALKEGARQASKGSSEGKMGEAKVTERTSWNRSHGMTNSREYYAWTNMKTRCLNSEGADYVRYGGRGIGICSRWISDFSAFFSDMGPCPEGMTLDRENNNESYSPDNCRWATRRQQSNNRRTNVLVKYHGELKTLAEWGRIAGVSYYTFRCRLLNGMTMDRAMKTGNLRKIDPQKRGPMSEETRKKISRLAVERGAAKKQGSGDGGWGRKGFGE